MAYVEVQTHRGTQKVKVCDYCRVCCCQSRFCSSRCYHEYERHEELRRKQNSEAKS